MTPDDPATDHRAQAERRPDRSHRHVDQGDEVPGWPGDLSAAGPPGWDPAPRGDRPLRCTIINDPLVDDIIARAARWRPWALTILGYAAALGLLWVVASRW